MILFLMVYTLMADQSESEPNGNRSIADGPINFNETLTGGLPGTWGGDSLPIDFWSFNGKYDGIHDTTYTFIATAQNCDPTSSPLDLALWIVDSGGGELEISDSGRECDPETISWKCDNPDTYFLIVYQHLGTPIYTSWYNITCQESTNSGMDDWFLY